MTNLLPDDIKEAASRIGGDYIKAAEFEGSGLTLKIVEPLEVQTANNPKYGAEEKNYLVKQELLKEGECLKFVFQDTSGRKRVFNTTSAPFFIAFKQAADQEVSVGDWVKIVRTGKTDKTRFSVVKTEVASDTISQAKKTEYPERTEMPDL